eukprot:g3019.t1
MIENSRNLAKNLAKQAAKTTNAVTNTVFHSSENLVPDKVKETVDRTMKVAKVKASSNLERLQGRLSDMVRAQLCAVTVQTIDKVVFIAAEKLTYELWLEFGCPPESNLGRTIKWLIYSAAKELVEELQLDATNKLTRKAVIDTNPDIQFPNCCRHPFRWIRSFILYHYLPFNKGIYQKLQSPTYLLLLLVFCFPLYNVSQIAWIIIFLLIDKHDEFQLCDFVMNFKTSQFFVALLKSITGLILYMTCFELIVVEDGKGDKGRIDYVYNCFSEKGPGKQFGSFLFSNSVFFAVQVFITWIGILLIPRSTPKGGKLWRTRKQNREIYLARKEAQAAAERAMGNTSPDGEDDSKISTIEEDKPGPNIRRAATIFIASSVEASQSALKSVGKLGNSYRRVKGLSIDDFFEKAAQTDEVLLAEDLIDRETGKKARRGEHFQDSADGVFSEAMKSKGGRLKIFLYYDIVIVTIVLAFALLAM